jgi:hypothetical protein
MSRALFVFFLAVAVCSCLIVAQPVAAQSSVLSAKPKGLTVSPLRSELDISPGTSLDGSLTVTNSTDKPMTVRLSAESFSVINQQYDYAFTAESELSGWVVFSPSEVTLAAGESNVIPYKVGAPLSAEPGGRYISLFASTDTEGSNGGVSSRQRIASLLYITVSGDVSRTGKLVSLSSPWLVGDKSTWSASLQNMGTTHFRSRYSVSVQDIFGNNTGVQTNGDALILPGTIRLVTGAIPLPQLPGLYKYEYVIGLGDTPAVSETHIVLYVPPVFVIGVAAASVLIVAFFLRRRSNKN